MKIQKLSPTCSIEPLEARIAPATIVNANTVIWTDTDGDSVTLTVSKSIFKSNTILSSVLTFDKSSGNQQLLTMNLTGLGAKASDMDITITATTPAGGTGDGKVNVGFIKAAIPEPDIFSISKGVDLGKITIGGDLGGIYAGDQFADTAIKSINVQSWGKLNSVEQTAQTAGTIPTDLHSIVLGPIAKISIGKKGVAGGDFDGTYGARLQVLGGVYGQIGSLSIIGSVIGGAADESGQIFVSKSMGNVTIGGSLTGGAGENSGTLYGNASSKTTFGDITIKGGLQGGAGTFSGSIFATKMGAVDITGNIAGYSNSSSASTVGSNSANIQGQMSSLHVGGSVLGGTAEFSGRVLSSGTISSVAVDGNVTGGTGKSSGSLNLDSLGFVTVNKLTIGTEGNTASGNITGAGDASGLVTTSTLKTAIIYGSITGGSGSFTGGLVVSSTLSDGKIGGSVVGGNATTASIMKSGFIYTGSIGSLEIEGDLVAGTASGSNTLFAGAAITATSTITKLTIDGNVTGNATASALISATGLTTGKTGTAISSLTINGNVDHANILAGYSPSTSNALGTPLNADAQIGTITIGKNISATNIVAGAGAGTDGKFGTVDDARISGTGTTDRANVVSSIASIIVNGQATTGSSGSGYGIVADQLGSIKIGTTAVTLNAGPNNDLTPIAITGTTDFQAIEITPPIAS